jgi:hypothetical protein
MALQFSVYTLYLSIMTFEEKKQHIIRCVKLGMDNYSAMIIAECTQDEIDLFENDEVFSKRLAVEAKLEERDLLINMQKVMDINVPLGDSTEVRWKLEKINPRRWGRPDANSGRRELPKIIVSGPEQDGE